MAGVPKWSKWVQFCSSGPKSKLSYCSETDQSTTTFQTDVTIFSFSFPVISFSPLHFSQPSFKEQIKFSSLNLLPNSRSSGILYCFPIGKTKKKKIKNPCSYACFKLVVTNIIPFRLPAFASLLGLGKGKQRNDASHYQLVGPNMRPVSEWVPLIAITCGHYALAKFSNLGLHNGNWYLVGRGTDVPG